MTNKKLEISSQANLTKNVMQKIESGGIKMKSKTQVKSEEIGFVVALVISVLGSAFIFNMLIFWARGTGNLHYLGLGSFGMLAFVRSFPHLWLWLAIILIAFAYLVLRHFDFSYKKPLGFTIAGLAVICLVVASVFASTPINQPFQKQAMRGGFGAPKAIFAPHMLPPHLSNGVVGIVTEINDQKIILDCCKTHPIEGKITDRTRFIPDRESIVPNIEVRVIGKKVSGEIEAVIVAKQEELNRRMPMLRQRLR